MRALISGSAGIAVYFEDDIIKSVCIDDYEKISEIQDWEIECIFRDIVDVVEYADLNWEQLIGELEYLWNRDRGLRLFLIMIDKNECSETRLLAAEALSELFDKDVKDYVIKKHFCTSC